MSDQFYNDNDPTKPVYPNAPRPPEQGRAGGFQDAQKSSQRRPYQNPIQPPAGPAQGYQQQGSTYPQNQQGSTYPQNQQGPAWQQVPPPISRPNDNRYQQNPNYQQPGQIGNRPGLPPKKRRRGRGCLITSAVLILLVVGLLITGIVTSQRVLAFGSAISPQSPLSSQINTSTNDRTNLLIMGFGGTGHDGAYLTDSLLTVSLLPQSHHTSLVSIPRDLWVQYPPNSGQYTKVNAVYTVASNANAQPIAGGDAIAAKLSLVTGLSIKNWMTINFNGFRDLINTIGGVDVNVTQPFNACYPKNDDANVDASWIKVQFDKGTQHMDGETAIRYARAREPLEVCGKGTSENQAQLSDFARSQRQQDIMKAALAKVKQSSTWPSFFNALEALQKTIYTNLSFSDLVRFVLAMDLNSPNTPHIGLTNGNVLQDSTAADGGYILQPQGGDWGLIPKYINQRLYN